MLSPIMARIRPQDLVAATITMLVLTLSGTAVAASNDSPMSGQLAVRPVSQLPVTALPAVDAEQRLNEDAAKTKPGPLRYAIPIDMSVTPDKHGTWEKLADGARLWRYRVHAPGATDLNFGFTRYHLPEGATLHVISEKQDYFHGPYTHEDNRDHGQHWTPMVPGDSAVIELYLSAKATSGVDHFDLELGRVGTGYRDLFGVPNLTRQGACNIDTICPQGDNWRDEIRSAGQYSLGGSFFCSGTIIMDVPGGFAPWWITANHCGLNAGNASSLVVLWNFEAAVCGALSGGIATDTQSGATWRAARSDADFTLLQLNSTPPPAFGVYYSGWDATGAVPQSSMGISHPSNDEKALAINDDPLGTTASCIGGATPNTHWNVGNYELGMTEPGSSGSGIWNPYSTDPLVPNNPKLVGVLSGGSAACNGGIPNTGFDCYGKFSVAWDGTGASTRLRDWLDPAGTGTLMVDGADPNGPAVCGDGQLGTGEQCDDGNTGSGDGCSSSCQVEPGFICTGEPSICAPIPEECSLPNLAIPDNNPTGVSDSVGITAGATIADLDVSIEAFHTWVGDLIVTLRHVDTGTSAVLLDRPGLPLINATFGCGNDNIDAVLDDAAGTSAEDQCSAAPPAIGGTHAPNNPLAVFNGESSAGTWTLTVSDNAGADTGVLTEWCVLATTAGADSDGDGVSDSSDNCIDHANPAQTDTDGDGHGNRCDPDFDQTCSVIFADVDLFKAAFLAASPLHDLDGDGGTTDFQDLAIVKDFFLAAPGPSAAPNLCGNLP